MACRGAVSARSASADSRVIELMLLTRLLRLTRSARFDARCSLEKNSSSARPLFAKNFSPDLRMSAH